MSEKRYVCYYCNEKGSVEHLWVHENNAHDRYGTFQLETIDGSLVNRDLKSGSGLLRIGADLKSGRPFRRRRLTKDQRREMSLRAKERIRLKKEAEERDALEKAIRYHDNYDSNLADRTAELRDLKKLHPHSYKEMLELHPKRKNENRLDYYTRLVSYIRVKHRPRNVSSTEHDRHKGKSSGPNPIVDSEPYW